MARRFARLTLDNLSDLPVRCRSCLFWELDPVRRQRAEDAGDCAGEKEAWVSRALLEWGSCGQIVYVDDDPAGYVLFAPATYFPGVIRLRCTPIMSRRGIQSPSVKIRYSVCAAAIARF